MVRWLVLLSMVAALFGQAVSDAERQRFEEIKARHDAGKAVSAEEQQFAQRIMQRMNQAQAAARNGDWAKAHPPRESTGLVALPALGTGLYRGEEGGLYPGGKNTPPPEYLAKGLELAKQVVPLDREGRPNAGGRIVLLSIGMSNTTQEFSAFQKLAAGTAGLNPKVTLVDGAQGGQTAAITANAGSNYWKVVGERLAEGGVSAAQVEGVWLKQANAQPSAPFPEHAKKLQADLVATLRNLHERFPNLKLCYLSSRIYGGYAVTPLNPEPYAYEGGFAVKWAIADEISGKLKDVPWIAWGPYLWADGAPVWTREDVGADGTHPSDAGRRKVAEKLMEFFRSDPTTKGWFLR
jgi:hypothetical protein